MVSYTRWKKTGYTQRLDLVLAEHGNAHLVRHERMDIPRLPEYHQRSMTRVVMRPVRQSRAPLPVIFRCRGACVDSRRTSKRNPIPFEWFGLPEKAVRSRRMP